jgi:hypothetical protein
MKYEVSLCGSLCFLSAPLCNALAGKKVITENGKRFEVRGLMMEDRGWKIENSFASLAMTKRIANSEWRTAKKFTKKSQLYKKCIIFAHLVKPNG